MSARRSSVGESNDECWSKKLPSHYSDGICSCILIHLKREKNVLALFTPSADGMSIFKFLFSRKLTLHCLFHKDLYFSHNSETFEFSHFFLHIIFLQAAGIAQLVQRLATRRKLRGSNPGDGKILPTFPGRH